MALLYEPVTYPRARMRRYQESTTKSYRIPFSSSLLAPLIERFASETKQMEIKWDEKVTTLNQVSIKGSVHGVQPFAAPSIDFLISVNGLAAVSRFGIGGCQTATFDTNIYGKIVNGTNTFNLDIGKTTPGVGTSGLDNILVEVEAQFVGQPPDIKPTPTTWLEKLTAFLQENALWIGVGTVAIVGIITVPKIIEARRRRRVAPAI